MANQAFFSSLLAQLENLKQAGHYRTLKKVIDSPADSKVIIDNKQYLVFCSNNYLGLANDPRLKEAAILATQKYGWGSGASRLICGNLRPHQKVEQALAHFKQAPAAILFPTGYMANVGTISALVGPKDTVIIDRLCHASIIDGCRQSRAKLQVYEHKDMQALEHILKRSQKFNQRLIVTDSVFSMDGDLAPLAHIVKLARAYNAITMVDEAHATGVLGAHGRGATEYLGVEGKIDIVLGTLSKAIGSLGGFVSGPAELIEYLYNRARSFIYTTAPPPAVCAATMAALEIIQSEPERRQRLWHNVNYIKQGLCKLGFDLGQTETQIIPIILGDETHTMQVSEKLYEQGILIPGIRPPTVPRNRCRLRLTVMAHHTKEELDYVLDVMRRL